MAKGTVPRASNESCAEAFITFAVAQVEDLAVLSFLERRTADREFSAKAFNMMSALRVLLVSC